MISQNPELPHNSLILSVKRKHRFLFHQTFIRHPGN